MAISSDFKKVIISRFLGTNGVQIQSVILGWHMYTLTHRPLFLGLIGLVQAIPALGLALFSGYIVDRNKPLPIYKAVTVLVFLSNLLLVLSHIPGLALPKIWLIVTLFVSSFLVGVGRAFIHPAIYALVPKLIDRTHMQKGAAWMTSAFQTASISGPAIGGFLYGITGMFWTSVIVCVLLFVSFVVLFNFKTQVPAAHHQKPDSLKKELWAGASYVFAHPVLFPAMSLDMIAVLFGGVTALLPIYAADVLNVGAVGLGCLRAAPSLGAAAISLWLTNWDIGKRAGPWLFAGVTGFGVCILVFALSHSFSLSLLALLLSGGFDSFSAVIRGSIVQLSSPDPLRGRISAINMMFISTSNELGEFESGTAAALMGTIPAAVFGGVICLMTVAGVAFFSKGLRQLDLSKLSPSESL